MKLRVYQHRALTAVISLGLCVALSAFLYLRYTSGGDTASPPPAGQAKPAQASVANVPLPRQTEPTAPNSAQRPIERRKYAHALDRDLAQFATEYPELAREANSGDASAALELYEGLKLCVGVPSNDRAMQDYREQLASTNDVKSPRYAKMLEFMEKQYAGCSRLTDEQRSSYKNWLATAAKLGNSDARVKFILEGPSNNPDTYYRDLREYQADVDRYISEELTAGNKEALFAASTTYGHNGLSRPDPVKEYAYLYAYVLANNLTQGVIFDSLQRLGSGMSRDDLAAAVAQGESIYRSCCAH